MRQTNGTANLPASGAQVGLETVRPEAVARPTSETRSGDGRPRSAIWTQTATTALEASTTRWDLVVIGGGTAGIVGAKTAARLGAEVLLIERDRTGGDCLWTGCVPSKALLAAASAAADTRRAGRYGVAVDGVRVDFRRVRAHVLASIEHIAPVDSREALRAEGITVLAAEAVLTGPDSVAVDGQRIRFQQLLLATGAAPAVPPIPGLAAANHLTSDTVWDLEDLPDDLLVLGGGTIGCELGQAFARLGTRVTIVEGAPRIMPREDAEAARLVAASLASDGVTILTGQGVTSVLAAADGSGRLVLDDGREVSYGHLLVAVGRVPRTRNLGLDTADVHLDARGFVVVDTHLRTTNPRIWAAGDLTGHPQFTHTAGVHGSLAASNAVLGVRRAVDTTTVPRVTFTHPEVAAVGAPTDPMPGGLRLIEWRNEHVDRAVTEDERDGFARLVIDRKGRVVGATIVGPRAGEALGEVTLAIKHGLSTRDLAGTTHPYPTYNDGAWNAAILDVRNQLARPTTAALLRRLAGLHRWWLDRRSA